MLRPDYRSLRNLTTASGLSPDRFITDGIHHVRLADLAAEATPADPQSPFHQRSVLLSFDRQLPTVLALLALDGQARRIVLCPPDLSPAYLPAIVAEAEVEVVASDGTGPFIQSPAALPIAIPSLTVPAAVSTQSTEWLLFTSGTTGRPKIVVHTLESLIGPLNDGLQVPSNAIWTTFYDIRRYGGLTILFRALLGGGSMVLGSPNESIDNFLVRASRSGVTHVTGTPSHWRRALMSPTASEIRPNYVRLSGEVADQTILDNLAAAFPQAEVAHAFASTEAGFAFDVRDRKAGFPAALIDQPSAKAQLRVREGSLRIRSPRTASRYLTGPVMLQDAEGFVDTADMVERRGERYYFVGRREGIINVGGQKVHPEEVEAVINQHPAVQMARVRGRSSPITGAIVVADIVVRPTCTNAFQTTADEIIAACRQALPPHKIPALLRQIPALDIAESGKMVR